MKKQIEGSDNMEYRQIVQRLLTDLLAGGVDERWNPLVDGHVDGSPLKRHRQTAQSDPPSKGRAKDPKGNHSNQPQQEGENGTEITHERNGATTQVGAAPVPNMRRQELDDGSESPNSLFDGEESDLEETGPEAQRSGLGEVSPELAGRIHMLQAA